MFWLSFADPARIEDEIAACNEAGALKLYTDADDLKQAEQVGACMPPTIIVSSHVSGCAIT